jgi:hypothetical protein
MLEVLWMPTTTRSVTTRIAGANTSVRILATFVSPTVPAPATLMPVPPSTGRTEQLMIWRHSDQTAVAHARLAATTPLPT